MLAILSEIHCLDYLLKRGIFPDEYFTDFNMFKNRAVGYRDATVVIITAGLCRFSKRHTVELAKLLIKRSENEKDRGISKVFFISDTFMPTLDFYYKFQDNMDSFTTYKGMDKVKENINVWSLVDDYQNENQHETMIFLSDFDKGILDTSSYTNKKVSFEEDLIRLIKQPNIKELITSSNT